MEDYTTKDLEFWVASMPLYVKAILRQGPIDEDYGYIRGESCRVCMALRPYKHNATKAMSYLSEWHNAVRESTEWYLRCLLIYLIAGWNGNER